MAYEIKKAAVLGAGVMGAGIAAHLANAGIECALLDIVPRELTKEDEKNGLTRDSKAFRNRFSAGGLQNAVKSKPASFYSKKFASMITVGNFEDDMGLLADVGWVIEVVVENLEIKKKLFAEVARHVRPDCIVSTNTSGIRIADISADFNDKLKQRFLGTHFFNPPRYLKLVELIPGEKTSKEVLDFMTSFCEDVLGKGVVVCKDVVNFVANRVGSYDLGSAMRLMVDKGLSVPELDAIIGKGLGRPGSAICGTIDLVGLDVGHHVMKNLYDGVPDDEEREMFAPSAFFEKMIENKWLGNKTGQGFYKRVKEGGKKTKLALDYNTMEYVAFEKPRYESVGEAKKHEGSFGEKLKILFNGKDIAAETAREYLCRNFIYATNRIPEIADDIASIDDAMRWGYNQKLGPFETWDALGVRDTVEVMKKMKLKVPKKVEKMLKGGFESFYVKKEDGKYVFDFSKGGYVKIGENPRIIILKDLKAAQKVIKENTAASIIDIGDGVVCFEFHTKMNAIDDEMIALIYEACDRVEKDYRGMVVANQGTNYSVGANVFKVLIATQMGEWDFLEKMVRDFQYANMRMKYCKKPVVMAPAGMALGGGCEIAMHGAMCIPCGETYIGLVEMGVGVIPAGGGTKELMVRCTEGIPDGAVENGLNMQTLYQKVFENIGMAKVATSAVEAKEHGFIRWRDPVAINRDHQIHLARQAVLGLEKFYRKPDPVKIPVMGDNFKGMARAILNNMKGGGFVTEYDLVVAEKLIHVIAGGDCAEGTWVTEDYILDMEREAFMSLSGEQRTQDRMMHIINTGKPLRN
ncbi:MAG: 3-hydroxyacyl-CoA dehydrogenase NAD-binding domain-containing protein [Pseudomonadota bacterium]